MRYLLFLFLISSLNSSFGYSFGDVALELDIPVNHEGECRKKFGELNGDFSSGELVKDMECLAFKKHIHRDGKRKRIGQRKIKLDSVHQVLYPEHAESKMIKGKMWYTGVMPLPYRYKMEYDGTDFNIAVKIYVKEFDVWKESRIHEVSVQRKDRFLKRYFDLYMEDISNFWSDPSRGINVKFVRVENSDEADFKIKLKGSLMPSLYHKKWTWMPSIPEDLNRLETMTDKEIRDSTSYDITLPSFLHEAGHFLGLEDEYSVLRNTYALAKQGVTQLVNPAAMTDEKEEELDNWARGCDQTSIMCKDWTKNPIVKDYHYYVILSRFNF